MPYYAISGAPHPGPGGHPSGHHAAPPHHAAPAHPSHPAAHHPHHGQALHLPGNWPSSDLPDVPSVPSVTDVNVDFTASPTRDAVEHVVILQDDTEAWRVGIAPWNIEALQHVEDQEALDLLLHRFVTPSEATSAAHSTFRFASLEMR